MSRDGNSVFTQDPSPNQPDVVKKKIDEAQSTNPLRVQDVSADPFGLDIPAETVMLPSQGKVYSKGHPLHNVETVEIYPMTAREEDILTTRAYLKRLHAQIQIAEKNIVMNLISQNLR
jgi:hypothetical protein